MKESTQLITAWKQKSLSRLLKIQVLAWLPGCAAGCWNALLNYQNSPKHPLAWQILLQSITTYLGAYLLLVSIAYLPRLSYQMRLTAMLSMYYLLSLGLFWLSALSGDARLILFVFLLFAALFLDPPYPYAAVGLSIFAFALMGWLHVSEWIPLTEAVRYNARDAKSWVSGAVVFTIIAFTTVSIVQFLFQSFARTLHQEQVIRSLLNLRNTLIQQIMRETTQNALFQKIVEILAQAGYQQAWLGIRSSDTTTWRNAIALGESKELEQQAAIAIQTGQPHQHQEILACPLRQEETISGAIVVRLEHANLLEEQQLFLEIATTLAAHLNNLEAARKRESLAQTARELLGERDESAIWKTTLTAIQTILHTERAAIYEYGPASQRLSCFHSSGLSQGYIQFLVTQYNLVPGSQLLTDPRPLAVNDIYASPLTQAIRPMLEQEHIAAYVVFPLFAQKQLIGAFVAYYNAPRAFSASDIEAGQTLAHFVSAAIQNARLFSETRVKSNEQAALFVAAQEMSANARDFRALLEFLARQMTQVLNVNQTLIFSFDETQNNVYCLASDTSDLNTELSIRQQPSPKIFATIRKGYPIVYRIDDPQIGQAEKEALQQAGIATQLILPLLWQGNLVGYIEVQDMRSTRTLSQHETMLAQSLAAHVANALYAAKLFEQIERREAYFRALTENSAESVAVLDENGNLKYISPTQEKILGYSTVHILRHRVEQKIHPQDLRAAQKAFLRILKNPNAIQTIACRVQAKNGQWVTLEATINNLLENPAIQGIVVNFRDVTRQKQAEEQLQQAYDETLAGWARALELRDKDTEGHTRRVTELTVQLALALKVDDAEIVHIRRGALLHDMGKVAIPDAILHKTDTLTWQEWEIMRQHPQYAYDMLKNIAYLQPALDIPYCHHEKWDGSGYPRGLKGQEIPLAARIFAIADVWDALTSDRPYRAGWEKQKTLEYIQQQAGKHFDPHIVRVFTELITQQERQAQNRIPNQT